MKPAVPFKRPRDADAESDSSSSRSRSRSGPGLSASSLSGSSLSSSLSDTTDSGSNDEASSSDLDSTSSSDDDAMPPTAGGGGGPHRPKTVKAYKKAATDALPAQIAALNGQPEFFQELMKLDATEHKGLHYLRESISLFLHIVAFDYNKQRKSANSRKKEIKPFRWSNTGDVAENFAIACDQVKKIHMVLEQKNGGKGYKSHGQTQQNEAPREASVKVVSFDRFISTFLEYLSGASEVARKTFDVKIQDWINGGTRYNATDENAQVKENVKFSPVLQRQKKLDALIEEKKLLPVGSKNVRSARKVSKNARSALAAQARGRTLYREKDYQGACDAWTVAINGMSDSYRLATLYGNRAAAKKELGNFLDGVTDCTRALEYDYPSSQLHAHRARCYMGLYQFAKAVNDYKSALDSLEGSGNALDDDLVQQDFKSTRDSLYRSDLLQESMAAKVALENSGREKREKAEKEKRERDEKEKKKKAKAEREKREEEKAKAEREKREEDKRERQDENGLYTILGVARTATPKEIEKKWRELCLKWHPDKWATATTKEKEMAESNIKLVNAAYDVLSDSAARRAYDC